LRQATIKQSRVEIRISHCLKQLLDCCLRLSNKMDKGKTNIQRDWEQREFIEDVTVNIKKVTEFLNRFGTSSSYIIHNGLIALISPTVCRAPVNALLLRSQHLQLLIH
jgi:hypothetical protein